MIPLLILLLLLLFTSLLLYANVTEWLENMIYDHETLVRILPRVVKKKTYYVIVMYRRDPNVRHFWKIT